MTEPSRDKGLPQPLAEQEVTIRINLVNPGDVSSCQTTRGVDIHEGTPPGPAPYLTQLLKEAWETGYIRAAWELRGTENRNKPPSFEEWLSTNLLFSDQGTIDP